MNGWQAREWGNMQFRVESYESVGSTNDLIKRAIEEGQPEGLTVRALRQTAGYGRQGRAWESPLGGLYQSFLLRPDVPMAQMPTLSLLVGVAARRAVVQLVPELADRAQVKWPNDLVVAPVDGKAAACASGGSTLSDAFAAVSEAASSGIATAPGGAAYAQPFLKLGGISLELHRGAVCVGVGVNVSRPKQGAPANAKNIPVFLDELGLSGESVEARIAAVSDALCEQLAGLYPQWCEEGFAPFAAEFDGCAALTGRFVRMEDIEGNPLASGTVERVAVDGRLVLRTPDGKEILASSGEAHIRA